MTTDANQPPGRRRVRRMARRQRPRLAGLIALFLIAGGGAVLLGLYLGTQLLGFLPPGPGGPGGSGEPGGAAAALEPGTAEPGGAGSAQDGGEPGSRDAPGEGDAAPDVSDGGGEASAGGTGSGGEGSHEGGSAGTGSGDGGGDAGDGTGGTSPETPPGPGPGERPPLPDDAFSVEAGPRTFYAVQVGAFSSRANADELAGRLRDAGQAAYIHTEDGHKVWMGLYDSRDAARASGEAAAEMLADMDAEFFVQQWVFHREVHLADVPSDMEGLLADAIAAVPVTIENLSAVWSRTVTGEEDAAVLAAAARDSIGRWQDMLAASDSPEGLAPQVGGLLSFYTRAAAYSAALAAWTAGEAAPGEFSGLMDEHMELAGEAAALVNGLGGR